MEAGKYDNIEVTRLTKFKIDKEGVVLDWECEGFGFGQLTIEFTEDGFKMDTESMSKEFAKALLCKMVDQADIK